MMERREIFGLDVGLDDGCFSRVIEGYMAYLIVFYVCMFWR